MRVTKAVAVAAVSVMIMTAAGLAQSSATTAPQPIDGPGGGDPGADPSQAPDEPGSGLWIVQLDEPPLATYSGGAPGLRATSPDATGDEKLDVAAPASVAYLDHLADVQADVADQIDDAAGRSVDIAYEYRTVLNGLAVEVTAEEAAMLARLPGVVAVVPDEVLELTTDVSHELIESAGVWEGDTGTGVGTRGEGVIVGMLDTGVNPGHPSFAAVDGDGYQHINPFGEGTYVGVCDPAHPNHRDLCNDKLIGVWDIVGDSFSGPIDTEGHGSHVGSTIAGNKHDAVFTIGTTEHTRTVQGVAPRANVISYKVCLGTSCFSSASVAAVDQAVIDGVDVLNYSISGPDNPWGNLVDLAFLGAFEAGVFVAASAGNSDPSPGNVSKTAPWNATVAATTHHRVIATVLDVTGPAPVPPELTGLVSVLGEGSILEEPVEAEIRYAGAVDPGNVLACDPLPAGALDGSIALIMRGECNFSVKVNNAANAGAVAAVVFNQYSGPPFVMGALAGTSIPAVMVSNDDGQRIRDFIADQEATVRVGTESALVLRDEWADIVTDFSSRGPSQFDLLAPTFATPGRGILAAGAELDGEAVRYEFMQGTSMASPHAAGAGALLTALHPDWSPAQIRSALAATADRDGIVKEDGVTPADPLDIGSGRINITRAAQAGLTLDESHDNFVAANPAIGGDPRELNLPAIVDQHCDVTCTFTREVTSVADADATYTAQVTPPDGVTVTVAPSEFTIAAGATQELTVTVDVSGLLRDEWLFGAIDLVTDATHGPDGPAVAGAHLPVVVLPAAPEMTVDPVELASTLDVAETAVHTVTIGNDGGAELVWSVLQDDAECALPGWVDVTPSGGTIEPFGEHEVTVTFDSTGLDDGGEFSATLCLDPGDPNQPNQTVDLMLTVVPIPVIEVTPAELRSGPVLAGTEIDHPLTVANTGHGVLEWTLANEGAGPSDERLELLRDGVLLVPNSAAADRGVMAFDPDTGDLIDPEFIPHVAFDPSTTLYTPKHILPKPDGTGFLMSDQVRWVITEHDLEGNFRGVFAPVGGERDPEIMGNIRGMAWSPWGTLLVTVAAQNNAHSIVELDADGEFLGTFIEPGQDGLNSPWYILFREDDVLVGGSGSSAIHSYSHDGTTANERFVDGINWPAQMQELDNGNILTVNWSGGDGPGVREFDANGNLVGSFVAAGSSYAGVHELGNGNILTTTSTGVYEIDRDGEVLNTKFAGGRARYITEVRMPGVMPCVTPDEVAWVSVSQDSGAAGAAQATELTVTLDTTGLMAGVHEVRLCVTSNDPATPLVSVPVSVEVLACTETIDGLYRGELVIDGVTCLTAGAEVRGPVTVELGASLHSEGAAIRGPVTSTGAALVELRGTTISGPVTVTGTTDRLVISSNEISGPVSLTGNTTGDEPIVVSGNRINGTLACTGNEPPPVNNGDPNDVTRSSSGQCADL